MDSQGVFTLGLVAVIVAFFAGANIAAYYKEKEMQSRAITFGCGAMVPDTSAEKVFQWRKP